MPALLIDDESSDQYQVTEPSCKIGFAATNDIVLTGEGISPIHVQIQKRGDDYLVALVPGAAPTRKVNLFMTVPSCSLNHKPLDGKLQKLVAGDKLQVGSRLMVLHVI